MYNLVCFVVKNNNIICKLFQLNITEYLYWVKYYKILQRKYEPEKMTLENNFLYFVIIFSIQMKLQTILK